MSGSEPESSGEKLKAEIAEQTRDIMREMFVEFKKEEKQEKQEQLRLEREIRAGNKSNRLYLQCNPLTLIMRR